MSLNDIFAFGFISIGLVFFFAGSIGLLRFPDVYTRLHALTKSDSLGLGFILLGLALEARDVWVLLKLLFIWFLVVLSSATTCYLVARAGLRMGIKSGGKSCL